MKLSDINTPTGRAATRRLGNQVQKAGVAAGKAPRLDLGVLGISIGQTQSTGTTSRVNEALASAGTDFDLIALLIKELAPTHPMTPFRPPKPPMLERQRASATAIDLMRRIMKGQDARPIKDIIRVMGDDTRKAVSTMQKLVSHNLERETAGAWLDDTGDAVQKSLADDMQRLAAHAHYLTGVSAILYALWVINSWFSSNMLDDYQTSMVKAAFKKMGIL